MTIRDPMPKTLKQAVKEWLRDDFEDALEPHMDEIRKRLEEFREMGIEKLRTKVKEHLLAIGLCQQELEKAYAGKGFDPYVDTRE